jgi:hypothetical protein
MSINYTTAARSLKTVGALRLRAVVILLPQIFLPNWRPMGRLADRWQKDVGQKYGDIDSGPDHSIRTSDLDHP